MDVLPVVCPHCEAADAVSLGRHDGIHLFECITCGRTFELQEFEPPIARFIRQAAAAGYAVTDRAGDALLAVEFERTGGEVYTLQWAVMPTATVRKLLDDRVHKAKSLGLDDVLDAIEVAERAGTRSAWPDAPRWHAVGVRRPAADGEH